MRSPNESGRRIRRVGVIALGALVVWLAVDNVAGLISPPPAVGHWRTRAGEQAYALAYDEVLASIEQPDALLDVATSYGTVRVLRWDGDEGGAPVVLLPGRSSGAPMWSENLPDWIGTRTLYAVDPLGDAGLSSQRVPLTSVDDQADWISETLAGLGVERAHIVGHSFGGANAAAFAVRHPAQVRTLTLLEPVIAIAPLPASAFFWATLTLLPVPQGVRDRALAEIGGTTVEDVRQRTPLSAMIDAATAHYEAAVPLPRTLTDDEWRSLSMPVRVDIAGVSSLAGGEVAAARVRRLLPDADVTVWPLATHSLPMQERPTLDPELLGFWRDHG